MRKLKTRFVHLAIHAHDIQRHARRIRRQAIEFHQRLDRERAIAAHDGKRRGHIVLGPSIDRGCASKKRAPQRVGQRFATRRVVEGNRTPESRMRCLAWPAPR